MNLWPTLSNSPEARVRRGKARVGAWLLAVLWGATFAAYAQSRSVEALLQEMRTQGFDSPSAMISALSQAPDRPDAGSPVEAQLRYFAALGQLSNAANDEPTMNRAIAGLEAAGQGGRCEPCLAQALILRSTWVLTREGGAPALKLLADAERHMRAQTPASVRASFYAARARNHRLNGDFAKSVKDAVEGLRLADEQGFAAWQVELNITLALDNAELGDYPRAQRYVDEAIRQAEQMGYDFQVAYGYLNLGHIHALRNDRAAQRKALTTALNLAKRYPDLNEVQMIALSNLADYHLGRSEYRQALDFAVEAANLAQSLGEQRSLAIALTNEGIALSHLGNVEVGIDKVKAAIVIAKRMNNNAHVIGMTHELIGIHERAGQYKEAVAALHEVAGFEKKLTAQERQRDVLALQEEFASERKEREIERLSAENARQAALVQARSAQRWMWLALAVAFALAALWMIPLLRRSRRNNRTLSEVNKALAEQSTRDPLTGTFNRRHFDALERMHHQEGLMPRNQRLAQPFVSFVALDLDHFKHINDSWGHDAGDAVLVDVARRLAALLRKDDAVIRWGGEEFVMVLPGTGAEGTKSLVARVLASIANEPVTHGGQSIRVTASAGTVTLPEDSPMDWREALQIADLAMYLSKSEGRNQAHCTWDLLPDAFARVTGNLVGAVAAGDVKLAVVRGPGEAA